MSFTSKAQKQALKKLASDESVGYGLHKAYKPTYNILILIEENNDRDYAKLYPDGTISRCSFISHEGRRLKRRLSL